MPPATRASPDARTASRQSVAETLSRIAAVGRSAERRGRACSVDADVRVTSRIQGASSARIHVQVTFYYARFVTAADNPAKSVIARGEAPWQSPRGVTVF